MKQKKKVEQKKNELKKISDKFKELKSLVYEYKDKKESEIQKINNDYHILKDEIQMASIFI